MEDYASLREENMTLEQQKCSLLNKKVELEKDLNCSFLKNQALQKKLNTTEQEAENQYVVEQVLHNSR